MTDESPTERVLRRSMIDEDGGGRPFSERVRHHRRTLEAYFKAGSIPRWMERVSEVDQGIARERRRFAERYRALKGSTGTTARSSRGAGRRSPTRPASTTSTS